MDHTPNISLKRSNAIVFALYVRVTAGIKLAQIEFHPHHAKEEEKECEQKHAI